MSRRRSFGRTCMVAVIAVVFSTSLCRAQSAADKSEAPADQQPAVPNMTLEEAIQAIQSQDPNVRWDGAKVLCSLGPKAAPAVDTVVKVLETHDLPEYKILLFVLITVGPDAKPAVPVLMKGLASENFHVRYLSCRALGHVGTAARPAVKKLIELVKDPITSVRRRAAEALGNLGPEVAPEALEPLMRAAEEHRHVVRIEAILALGKFGAKAKPAVPILTRIMRNPKSAERAQAAWALCQVTGETDSSLTVLAEELHRKDRPWEAAEFLVRMTPKIPKAVEVLATGLRNPDPEIREIAAESLGKSGVAAAPMLGHLQDVAGDEDDEVRAAVREAIAAIEKAKQNTRSNDQETSGTKVPK